jgi:branched-chain amino acid transport system ATP-binding protein
MTALIEAHGLRARYGEIEVLHGIDVTVAPGSVVALLGANGSGKTSTLRALTGSIRVEGAVFFDGQRLRGRAEDAAARGIAHVPEGRGTLSSLTVAENLRLGAYTRRDRRAVQRRLEAMTALFPWIAARRNQQAGTLSGGEQQMLAIARALMMEPRLLLLDEPSLGLAPLVVREIFGVLAKINREDGVTILVAEQNASIALATADHAYVLDAGRVVLHGPSSELVNDDAVRRSYLGY